MSGSQVDIQGVEEESFPSLALPPPNDIDVSRRPQTASPGSSEVDDGTISHSRIEQFVSTELENLEVRRISLLQRLQFGDADSISEGEKVDGEASQGDGIGASGLAHTNEGDQQRADVSDVAEDDQASNSSDNESGTVPLMGIGRPSQDFEAVGEEAGISADSALSVSSPPVGASISPGNAQDNADSDIAEELILVAIKLSSSESTEDKHSISSPIGADTTDIGPMGANYVHGVLLLGDFAATHTCAVYHFRGGYRKEMIKDKSYFATVIQSFWRGCSTRTRVIRALSEVITNDPDLFLTTEEFDLDSFLGDDLLEKIRASDELSSILPPTPVSFPQRKLSKPSSFIQMLAENAKSPLPHRKDSKKSPSIFFSPQLLSAFSNSRANRSRDQLGPSPLHQVVFPPGSTAPSIAAPIFASEKATIEPPSAGADTNYGTGLSSSESDGRGVLMERAPDLESMEDIVMRLQLESPTEQSLSPKPPASQSPQVQQHPDEKSTPPGLYRKTKVPGLSMSYRMARRQTALSTESDNIHEQDDVIIVNYVAGEDNDTLKAIFLPEKNLLGPSAQPKFKKDPNFNNTSAQRDHNSHDQNDALETNRGVLIPGKYLPESDENGRVHPAAEAGFSTYPAHMDSDPMVFHDGTTYDLPSAMPRQASFPNPASPTLFPVTSPTRNFSAAEIAPVCSASVPRFPKEEIPYVRYSNGPKTIIPDNIEISEDFDALQSHSNREHDTLMEYTLDDTLTRTRGGFFPDTNDMKFFGASSQYDSLTKHTTLLESELGITPRPRAKGWETIHFQDEGMESLKLSPNYKQWINEEVLGCRLGGVEVRVDKASKPNSNLQETLINQVPNGTLTNSCTPRDSETLRQSPSALLREGKSISGAYLSYEQFSATYASQSGQLISSLGASRKTFKDSELSHLQQITNYHTRNSAPLSVVKHTATSQLESMPIARPSETPAYAVKTHVLLSNTSVRKKEEAELLPVNITPVFSNGSVSTLSASRGGAATSTLASSFRKTAVQNNLPSELTPSMNIAPIPSKTSLRVDSTFSVQNTSFISTGSASRRGSAKRTANKREFLTLRSLVDTGGRYSGPP